MGGAIAIQSGNVVIDDVSFVNNKAIGEWIKFIAYR